MHFVKHKVLWVLLIPHLRRVGTPVLGFPLTADKSRKRQGLSGELCPEIQVPSEPLSTRPTPVFSPRVTRSRSQISSSRPSLPAFQRHGSSNDPATCLQCGITISQARNMRRHLGVCKGSPLEQVSHQTQGARSPLTESSPCQTSIPCGTAVPAVLDTPHSQHSGVRGDESHVLLHSPMLFDVITMDEITRQSRLVLPRGGRANAPVWAELDSKIDTELQHVFPCGFQNGDLDFVVQRFTDIVRSFFPCVSAGTPRRTTRPRDPVPRDVRAQLRELRRLWNHRDPSDLRLESDLKHQRNVLRKAIRRSLRSHTQHLLNTQLRNNVKGFREDPFGFSKKLFRSKSTVSPSFSKSVADAHFKSVYADGERATVFLTPEGLSPAPAPSHPFPSEVPSLAEVRQVLRKCRNSSSPGPNGIPYVLYKRLPSLHRHLHGIFCRVWQQGVVPLAWRVANMVLLPKGDDASHPSLMRNIALSNVEGKVCMSLVSSKLASYMLRNRYLDGLSQKGFLPGVSGCVEHNAVIDAALSHAQKHKKDICLTFVDFANAFGSVRHALIQFALQRYHVPHSVRALLHAYYDFLYAQVQVCDFKTDVFHYGIGVFQGCTASPVLFNMVMQILLDILHQPLNLHLGYYFGKRGSSSRDVGRLLGPAFADDLTLVTKSREGSQLLLDLLYGFLLWSTMRLKVPKCMSIAFGCLPEHRPEKVWSSFDPELSVGGQQIPVMSPEGCKYLGRRLNPTLSESDVKKFIEKALSEWLSLVHSTQLLGAMKCWIYNHFIIPKLTWFFTIHDLSLSYVKGTLRAIIMPFLKSWCGIPKRGVNTAILFCGKVPSTLGLSLLPVHTAYKASQVVRRSILHRSRDPTVRLVFELELARQVKWRGPRFAAARELLNILGCPVDTTVHSHHAGLGYSSTSQVTVTQQTASSYFYDVDSHALLQHASTLQMQGKLGTLDECAKRDWSWQRLLYDYPDGLFRWKINALNNSLPSGDNVRRWSVESVAPHCAGCGTPGPTLRHILNGCTEFLRQNRYTWRHNQVLLGIFSSISSFVRKLSPQPDDLPFISFVRSGEGGQRTVQCPQGAPRARRPLSQGILDGVFDWEMFGDGISESYSFPPDVAITSLRPDIFLVSRTARKCVLLELTVPSEDRVLASANSKSRRYQALVREISSNGFQCSLFTIEVGCRGNDTRSLRKCLRALGLSKNAINAACREAAYTALRCSYVVFLSRRDPVWRL